VPDARILADPGMESTGGFGAGSRSHDPSGKALERRSEAQESIGRLGTSVFEAVRTSAGNNALESRGILTSWSSEQKGEMSETTRGPRRRKAYRSAEGKGSEG
jgi:hypothetical protein